MSMQELQGRMVRSKRWPIGSDILCVMDAKGYGNAAEAIVGMVIGESQSTCREPVSRAPIMLPKSLNCRLLTTFLQPLVCVAPECLVLLRDIAAGNGDTGVNSIPESECFTEVVVEVY